MRIFHEARMSDSPARIISTPNIMGFRTYACKPVTTSFFVGLQGARVPFPFRINDEIVILRMLKPIMETSIPKHISITQPKRLKPVSQYGTRMRTVTGKTNETRFAIIFFILTFSHFIPSLSHKQSVPTRKKKNDCILTEASFDCRYSRTKQFPSREKPEEPR